MIAPMRRLLRKKTRWREFRTFGMFIEASLTDEDTSTLLAEFQAQALDPLGLGFRGHIVNHALSGVIELGLRDNYEANQERILVWLLRHPLVTSVDKSSLYEYGVDRTRKTLDQIKRAMLIELATKYPESERIFNGWCGSALPRATSFP